MPTLRHRLPFCLSITIIPNQAITISPIQVLPNDHNGSGHLAVFDFNSSHLFQLTGSESAPEGNYSIVEQDDGQGGTYLTALMQFTNGQWQEDSQGIPYPLDSQAFPVMQDVDAFLQSQNLYPVNEPQGYPILI